MVIEPPKRHAHCVRRKKNGAHIMRTAILGAGAQRLWRFGGFNIVLSLRPTVLAGFEVVNK